MKSWLKRIAVFSMMFGVFAVVQCISSPEVSAESRSNVSTLTTDAPLPDAKTGTPLPAGGGEPGKAYMTYLKAIKNKDLKTIRKIASLEIEDVAEFEMGESLDMLAEMAPTNVNIIKGFTAGSRASIYAEGISENEKQYGTIEMVREKSGEWRLEKENWSNVKPKKW